MTGPDRPAASDSPASPASSGPAVLDASAVLAWLRAEPGADLVESYLEAAVISAVNLSEIYQKLAQRGVDADRTLRQLRTLGIGVEPVTATDAVTAATLWPVTRAAGLSLGDRCCLALATRLEGPAVTADTAWTQLEVGVTVVPIR
ncbi:type II toxin-antitoxin system VapC family toxin [Pseudonocardia sp. EC080625-04]|uniref:type II toxin-antitoxin system VapC family toxin n=1 Tax=Pseudonocardia sp. EC080625-04 TaxID=1096868 RepID=UPI0009E98527|nr:type II toxin-antitoxin system VapC family toxin [Pseudonocardia sp. EC080625-04]